jgi:hypothetical protein
MGRWTRGQKSLDAGDGRWRSCGGLSRRGENENGSIHTNGERNGARGADTVCLVCTVSGITQAKYNFQFSNSIFTASIACEIGINVCCLPTVL